MRALRRLCLCTVAACHWLASCSAKGAGSRVAAAAVFASEMGEALKVPCVRNFRLLTVHALRPACLRRHGRACVDAARAETAPARSAASAHRATLTTSASMAKMVRSVGPTAYGAPRQVYERDMT